MARDRRGETVRARGGSLDAGRWLRLAPHLDRALDLSETARGAWLADLRGRDPGLAAEIQTLLDEHEQLAGDSFLEGGPPSSPLDPHDAGSGDRRPEARYQVGEEHARGGMGRILRARDSHLERTVAIKELLRSGPDAEARFLREAKLTARLEHPSIVPVHDAGRWQNGRLYYSMKLVTGRPLSELATGEALSLRERLGLVSNVLAVADAVAYAHSQGVIHRDVKPANVLVGVYGETLVVDWGLAKELGESRDPAAGPETSGEAGMTAFGTVMGTPAFMPPEQARGQSVDERADVYALGAMAYFVLSGSAPYEGSDSRAVLDQLLNQPPRALRELVPEAPADLVAIIDKAMARSRGDRYASAGEMAADLRRFLTGQLVSARAYSWPQLLVHWARRHRVVATLSAAFLAILLVATTAFVVREQRLRRIAEEARDRADRQSRALLIENGRRELERGRPLRAAVYLAEAYRHEPANLPLRHLITQATRQLAAHQRTLGGHARDVVAAAFSSDGARVATGSTDETVRLWEVASGRTLQVLPCPRSPVEDVAWSADGAKVASVGRATFVFDTTSGELIKTFSQPGFRVRFSPDGRWLVVGSKDGRLVVWDTATWEVAHSEKRYDDRLSAIAFHPRGDQAVTTSWDQQVTVWALPAWRPIRTLDDHRTDVGIAEYSRDGRWLLTGDDHFTLHVRDAGTGAIAHTLTTPQTARLKGAAFSPDGRSITTGSTDGVIRVWHATSGALLSSMDAIPDGKLFDIAFAPDGHTLVTSSLYSADVWRLAPEGYRILRGQSHAGRSGIYRALYSRDGRRILGASQNGSVSQGSTLRIWDAGSGAELRAWSDPGSGYGLAASADLSRVVLGAEEKLATRLWNSDGPTLIAELPHGDNFLRALAVSQDGRLVVAASENRVRLWRGDSGAPAGPEIVIDGATVTAVALDATAAELAIADSRGRLRVHDLVRQSTGPAWQAHPTWINGLSFSPDGAWLASAGRQDHTAKVWSARTGALRASMRGHTDNLIEATFSPDGQRLATAAVDHTVRIWDAARGDELLSIRGPGHSARFSPDGNELLTTGLNDYAVIWSLQLEQRSPAQIHALVQAHTPFVLQEGQLTLRPPPR